MQAIVEASPPIAAVAWLKNTPQAIGSGGAKRFTVSIQDEAFSQIRTGSTIKINGKAHRVADVLSEGRRVTYLGEQSDLLRGRNEIEIESIKLHVWNAEHVLNRFEHPYKKSHAIIAAIDAYDEAVDPRVRSNFQKLEGMVARADELRSTLVNLGFPKRTSSGFLMVRQQGRTSTTPFLFSGRVGAIWMPIVLSSILAAMAAVSSAKAIW